MEATIKLLKSIDYWNENRVPLLRISNPDKNLNFQGAMRFYFQDKGQKFSTKCIIVKSTYTTKQVIDILIEKFRPDMRMLSVPDYGLYEIHENGEERRLDPNEKPLLVQLEWNKDDREGRFLLRRMDEKTIDLDAPDEEPSLKRKSKKEKKKHQQKDNEKMNKNSNGIAERLYNELPETSFTRSISNPEAVMKRRRAQKLANRLQEFSLKGGQDAGGTLRIFGDSLNKDISYKTILLSNRETAASVVKQTLEKYSKTNEDPANYCLAQVIVSHAATSGGKNNSAELVEHYTLNDEDCPLLIHQNHDTSKGILTFHIRARTADQRTKKKPEKKPIEADPLMIFNIQLRKKDNLLGLSIIAAKGINQDNLGIYIKNVVKNGAAAMDGRLEAGDQLLEVDRNSLINVTQDIAAELMQRTGQVVNLRIAKQAALYHNLGDVINNARAPTSAPPQALPPPPDFAQPPIMNPTIEWYLPFDTMSMQFQPLYTHQIHQYNQFVQPDREVYFQPPPMELNHHYPSPSSQMLNNIPISPPKSPKKVSWVDTRAHKSLHTLIPPSPAPIPSPTNDEAPPLSFNQAPTLSYDQVPPLSYDEAPTLSFDEAPSPTSDETPSPSDEMLLLAQNRIHKPQASIPPGQSLDTTTESLTLEDIDEVLSSKTHNNWLEDSAGVIGTQEVYNDPRQRIVKERERPNEEQVNIEKLSFQEKLKMFNLSGKK